MLIVAAIAGERSQIRPARLANIVDTGDRAIFWKLHSRALMDIGTRGGRLSFAHRSHVPIHLKAREPLHIAGCIFLWLNTPSFIGSRVRAQSFSSCLRASFSSLMQEAKMSDVTLNIAETAFSAA